MRRLPANLITLEQGLRFLTDVLQGDHYYKTARPRHNLDRCRTQFKLLESFEQSEPELTRLVQLSLSLQGRGPG